MLSSIYHLFRNRKPGRHGAIAALALAVLAALLGAACQPTKVLNGLTPKADFTLQRDIAYGPHPRQVFDLYLPSRGPVRRTPVVFVYGGAWTSGDKDQYLFVGQAFAELGYVTLIPDYRLYPEAAYPDFVDDVAAAVAAAGDLAGLDDCPDPARVVLAGHSAGAHTAALLAFDSRYWARRDAAVEVAALIGLAGPYDLPLQDPLVAGKFDRRASDDEVKPVALAGPGSPPALLLHGAADTTVSPRHTQRLQQRLADAGVPVQVRLYPDAGHRMLVGALAQPLRFALPVQRDIAAFLQASGLDRRCADTM